MISSFLNSGSTSSGRSRALEQELYQRLAALVRRGFALICSCRVLLPNRCFVDRLLPGQQLLWQQLAGEMGLL
ncbi:MULTISPECIES: hypothetical protein [Pseudomonas]|jgi:hypothetical protein|uniref:hypothetical protein n=1 Tax=Pseudomonas TaxID=286 RepID=UPI000AD9E042|nr:MULTISPECIES: hypothetical protein [Pseudomonas]